MSSQPLDKKRLKSLLETIAGIETTAELKDFINDLCTPAEKTKISTTTITRVGRALKYGTGGYKKAINRSLS
jgi:uncharacterized protein YerC